MLVVDRLSSVATIRNYQRNNFLRSRIPLRFFATQIAKEAQLKSKPLVFFSYDNERKQIQPTIFERFTSFINPEKTDRLFLKIEGKTLDGIPYEINAALDILKSKDESINNKAKTVIQRAFHNLLESQLMNVETSSLVFFREFKANAFSIGLHSRSYYLEFRKLPYNLAGVNE